MIRGSSTINAKGVVIPTVIKNRPSNKPLKGVILASSSCLNSESANSTPVKNAPNVVLIPSTSINTTTPRTINNPAAVTNSVAPLLTMNLKKGRMI